MDEKIKNYLNEQGQIKGWPSKKIMKEEVLQYLSTKFEENEHYTEKEVNAIVEQWHTFGDYFLLRRGLIESKLLFRTKDGAKYWKL
ncbi:MAG: DUF2087 domain-containing protein [Bacillaceae bacterium]